MNAVEYQRMFEAEDRHWWYITLRELVDGCVAAEHARRGPLRIFDAGCGTGGNMARLARFGRVEGCDVSPEAVAACARRGLRDVRCADLASVDLPPAAFDVVTVLDVLYHRWVGDDAAVLRRLFNALRPGGLLLVNEAAFESLRSPHDEAVMTRHRYRPRELRERLEDAGFRVEHVSGRLALLYLPIALFRAVRRLQSGAAGEGAPASDVWLPPRPLNALLELTGKADNAMVRRFAVPFGTSVFAVARRPA